MNGFAIAIGKFFANFCSAFFWNKTARHRVREALHPLNPERCIRYLAKHYIEPEKAQGETGKSPAASGEKPCTGPASAPGEKEYIWQCWLQGREAAPPLVKNCLDSVARHAGAGQEVVLITEQNFGDYVELPDFILRKRQAGIIGNAHFADILRIYLLAKYGGYWIDATCLLTEPIPEEIRRTPFFMFHSGGEFSYTLIQNCFIHSRRGDYMIERWRQLLTDYLAQEKRWMHYFMVHLMFVALVRYEPEFRRCYGQMPVVPEGPTHVLQEYMKSGAKFSESAYEEAVRNCFLHKLTYKFPEEYLKDGDSWAARLSRRGGAG